MLNRILRSAGISTEAAANLLGVNVDVFHQWVSGRREIPYSYERLLSSVLGVDLHAVHGEPGSEADGDIAPAVWYKFRGPGLTDEDREAVFVIRRLGHFVTELEDLLAAQPVGWQALFGTIREKVDHQAPPRVQGRTAAQMFTASRELGLGRIGDVIRGNLRALGLLVVESGVKDSRLEGCCFLVGPRGAERPCVFANLHRSTWFRRNIVLLHEVCHAIFEVERTGASVDLEGDVSSLDIAEQRAEAFALEVLASSRVLRHVGQAFGIRWDSLTPETLARLVAELQVEKGALVDAAIVAGLIPASDRDRIFAFDITDLLPSLTDHALSVDEFIEKVGDESLEWRNKRDTTLPSRTLRLPITYVKAVVAAVQEGEITPSRASEMLMIDERTFAERFAHLCGTQTAA